LQGGLRIPMASQVSSYYCKSKPRWRLNIKFPPPHQPVCSEMLCTHATNTPAFVQNSTQATICRVAELFQNLTDLEGAANIIVSMEFVRETHTLSSHFSQWD